MSEAKTDWRKYAGELEEAVVGYQADVQKLKRELGEAREELAVLRDRVGQVCSDRQEYRVISGPDGDLTFYTVRKALEGLLALPPILFPKVALEEIAAGIKAAHPVYRRSGMRKWLERNVKAGALDPKDTRTSMVLLACDVLETMNRPVPQDVERGLCPDKWAGRPAPDRDDEETDDGEFDGDEDEGGGSEPFSEGEDSGGGPEPPHGGDD